MQHKFHNWKYAFILKGGGHALIQATLASMLTYCISKIMDKSQDHPCGKVLERMEVCMMGIGRLISFLIVGGHGNGNS